jgi:hypothetical protein
MGSERECHYCGSAGDLRPYGPGGSSVCFPCATTPERNADTEAAFGALLEASSAIGDPLIVGGTAEQRRQVLDAIDINRAPTEDER